MNLYGPLGNAGTNFDPTCYFDLAIEQIQQAELSLRTSSGFTQVLPLHLEVFLWLSKRFPDTASQLVGKLNRGQVRETFYSWYERWRESWIADPHRPGPLGYPEILKQVVDPMFLDLDKI